MLRPEVLLTASLITAGAVGGVIYSWPSSAPDETPIEVVKEEETRAETDLEPRGLSLTLDDSTELDADPVPTEAMELGDRLLLGGNYIGAYQQYDKIKPKASGVESRGYDPYATSASKFCY